MFHKINVFHIAGKIYCFHCTDIVSSLGKTSKVLVSKRANEIWDAFDILQQCGSFVTRKRWVFMLPTGSKMLNVMKQ